MHLFFLFLSCKCSNSLAFLPYGVTAYTTNPSTLATRMTQKNSAKCIMRTNMRTKNCGLNANGSEGILLVSTGSQSKKALQYTVCLKKIILHNSGKFQGFCRQLPIADDSCIHYQC